MFGQTMLKKSINKKLKNWYQKLKEINFDIFDIFDIIVHRAFTFFVRFITIYMAVEFAKLPILNFLVRLVSLGCMYVWMDGSFTITFDIEVWLD